MKRRLLAGLLVLCLTLMLLPTAVWAASSHDIGQASVTIDDSCGDNCQGHVIFGTCNSLLNRHKISINGGRHTITLQNINIQTPGTGSSALDIYGGAEVTLVLEGDNTLQANGNKPAIWVESGSSLTIEGSGSLTALAGGGSSGTGAAGIGSAYGGDTNFGDITINSGTVYARGTGGGAGIGGGYQIGSGSVDSNITINGGHVIAIGGESTAAITGGAGIGSGENADYNGTITINGGVVYAEGGANSASIGGGGRGIGESGNGTFSTGTGGNAVIVAPDGIGDVSGYENWDGIFISYGGDENTATVSEGRVVLNGSDANVQVWGNPEIDYPLSVQSGTELRVVPNSESGAPAVLTVTDGGSLNNDGAITIGDGCALILENGLSQTSGEGSLTCSGTVMLPPEEALITLANADNLTYNGREQTPAVTVSLSLWGYSQTYTEGTDYTVSYTGATNAGDNARAVVTSDGTGNLLAGSAYKTFAISPAGYNIIVPQTWTVSRGEEALLRRLPARTILIDPSITDDLTGLNAGTLTWYTDAQHEILAADDYLQSNDAGDEVTLYWVFTHSDENFTPLTTYGETKVTVTDLAIPEVTIEGENIDNSTIYKTYGDEGFALSISMTVNSVPVTPENVSWSSSNTSVATVDQSGAVTITGSGTAVITASVAEKGGEGGYAAVSGHVTLSVSKKQISVNDSTVTLNGVSAPYSWAYNGATDVTVSAQLEENSLVSGDDGEVILEASGTLTGADAGNRQVNIRYSLSGSRAQHYILTPNTAVKDVVIAKAAFTLPAPAGTMTVANRKADTYRYSLAQLTEGLTGLGTVTYAEESVEIVSGKEAYFNDDNVTVAGNTLTLAVNAVESDAEEKVAELKITISSTNYLNFTGTVTVNSKNLNLLTYDANGGSGGPGTELVDDQSRYTLKQEPKPTYGQQEGVVFIGWTAAADSKIYAAGDTAPAVITEVDISGDTTVYASWGLDTNGNGTADVVEDEKYTLTYDQNLLDGGVLEGALPQGGVYVSGNTVVLDDASGLSLSGTATVDKGDAVFAGWSLTPISSILSKTDTMSTGIVEQVTFTDSDITVYAVWAWDEDDDGIPDIMNNPSVTASAGENGDVVPAGKVYVPQGQDQMFTFVPDSGYAVDRVEIDAVAYINNGVNILPDTSGWEEYTFANVQQDHTLSVTFGADSDMNGIPDANEGQVALTYDANGGSGDAPAEQLLNKWSRVTVANNTFSLSGYSFVGWNTADDGSGTAYMPGDTLQLEDTAVTLYAQWSYNGSVAGYSITASAGDGGSISPRGAVWVMQGGSQTFTFKADDGYTIADVLVDGQSVGAVEKYTFENVRASHTIEAVFVPVSAVADPDETGVSDWLNVDEHMAYLAGYPDGSFGPDLNMTRAEVAQMFYNLLLNQNVEFTAAFEDVDGDAWYADAVNTLAGLGVISGVGDGRYEPERAITRAEFTAVAMRFTRLETSGENIFSDVDENDWFCDVVVGAVGYGWINGYGDGTFRPDGEITRAEASTVVNRMLNRAADRNYVDSSAGALRMFSDLTDAHWAWYDIMEAVNAHAYVRNDGVEEWTDSIVTGE